MRWLPLAGLLVAACGHDHGPAGDAVGSGGGPDFSADTFASWAGGPDHFGTWPAGPPHDPAFFPIAVWLQAPQPNGAAYKAIGINTFVELSWGGLNAANFDAVEANGVLATNGQDTGYAGFVGRS